MTKFKIFPQKGGSDTEALVSGLQQSLALTILKVDSGGDRRPFCLPGLIILDNITTYICLVEINLTVSFLCSMKLDMLEFIVGVRYSEMGNVEM